MVGMQSVSVLFRFRSVVGFLCFEFGPVRPLVFFFFLKISVWAFFFSFFFLNAVFKLVVFWPFLGLLCSLLLSLF